MVLFLKFDECPISVESVQFGAGRDLTSQQFPCEEYLTTLSAEDVICLQEFDFAARTHGFGDLYQMLGFESGSTFRYKQRMRMDEWWSVLLHL